eukprot:1224155-Pleurochrysis_carterae.AAC.1
MPYQGELSHGPAVGQELTAIERVYWSTCGHNALGWPLTQRSGVWLRDKGCLPWLVNTSTCGAPDIDGGKRMRVIARVRARACVRQGAPENMRVRGGFCVSNCTSAYNVRVSQIMLTSAFERMRATELSHANACEKVVEAKWCTRMCARKCACGNVRAEMHVGERVFVHARKTCARAYGRERMGASKGNHALNV